MYHTHVTRQCRLLITDELYTSDYTEHIMDRSHTCTEQIPDHKCITPAQGQASPNLADTGTRFLRGPGRSLQGLSSSFLMWRRKFSRRIARITLTRFILLSLSLEKTREQICRLPPRSQALWDRWVGGLLTTPSRQDKNVVALVLPGELWVRTVAH